MFEKVSRSLKYDSNFFFVHKHIYIYGLHNRSLYSARAARAGYKHFALTHYVHTRIPTKAKLNVQADTCNANKLPTVVVWNDPSLIRTTLMCIQYGRMLLCIIMRIVGLALIKSVH